MIEHKTISLADQVFEHLENDILSGKYQRGEILTESKLSAELGVSRTPIREALRRLEQEHIIEESGKGSVVIDCQTLGQQAVYVKIGSSDARQLNAANRQQLSIPYDVAETTRIYVYAAKGSAPVASQSARAAYPNDNAVKLYGLTINVDENLSGISAPVTTDRPTTDTWYTLDGRRLGSKPTMKGVYIRNDRKVVVR